MQICFKNIFTNTVLLSNTLQQNYIQLTYSLVNKIIIKRPQYNKTKRKEKQNPSTYNWLLKSITHGCKAHKKQP